MDEFDLIRSYFAPLATLPDALGLRDDAALLFVPEDETLVATTDMISAGVHFVGDEPPALIAQKLLRVNLSDLAAMGARPYAYLLGLAVPHNTKEAWFADFAKGLAEGQAHYGIALTGGDTTATTGPLTLSLTALGYVKQNKALLRSGAKPGDAIFVSGALGDAALGLKMFSKPAVKKEMRDYLINRYQLPEPRLALGQALVGIASAAMDISDGLVQDLGHICTASGCGAVVEIDALPLSDAALKVAGKDQAIEYALSGGDDYELLFTVPPDAQEKIKTFSEKLSLPLTHIGHITEGGGVKLLDKSGKSYALKRVGYKHF